MRVEELRTCGSDEHHSRFAHVLGEVFEQSDLAALRPVEILEHEDSRLRKPDAFDQPARGEEEQLHLRHFVFGREAEQECEVAERLLGLVFGEELLDVAAQLFARESRRVRLEDPADVAGNARERLIARLVLVGQAAAAHDPPTVLSDERGDLLAQP